MTHALSKTLPGLDTEDVDVVPGRWTSSETDFNILQAVQLLKQSQWLTHSKELAPSYLTLSDLNLPEPTPHLLKTWMQSVKNQESLIAHSQQNAQESIVEESQNEIADTEQRLNANQGQLVEFPCPPHWCSKWNQSPKPCVCRGCYKQCWQGIRLQWQIMDCISHNCMFIHKYICVWSWLGCWTSSHAHDRSRWNRWNTCCQSCTEVDGT